MHAVLPRGTSLASSWRCYSKGNDSTMAIREDRAMTNVQLWILLWQKQISDKQRRAGT
jgi:hypothetical protein